MQKSFVIAALAGGVLLGSSAAVAQNVASLPAGQTSQLVFLDHDGISSTGRNMLGTIASEARGARTVELLGAPPYAEAVKRQLIQDGVPPSAIIVRQRAATMLPSPNDAISNPQERSVQIRMSR
jgi:hypothetical protein